MSKFLLVCLGGAFGSGARYLVSLGLGRMTGSGFPWATLTVNCVGSFLIELTLAFVLSSAQLSETVRLGLATGFLGGFTTYSTFNHDVLSMFRGANPGTAFGYIAATLIGAVVFGLAGLGLGRALWPAAG